MARQNISLAVRLTGAFVSLFLLVGVAMGAEEKVAITHYGGPDFVIADGSAVIYVDPLVPNAPNFIRHFKAFRKTNHPVPDLVLITHSHSDHCNVPALRELLKLNPHLRVIAPVDARDALDSIFPSEQLITPIPKAGQPVTLTHGAVKVRAYRTLHGWLTDDALPYNFTFPFHHTYLIETKGYRILVSGDSYDFQQVARDFHQVHAVLWHIYKPSDIFDLQAMQPLFRPAVFLPHHLNIRYGLQQPEMAALTDRYRFQEVNVVYLIEGSDTFVLGQRQPVRPEVSAADGGLRLEIQVDRLFRGLQEPHTAQVLAHVRNQGQSDAGGAVSLTVPQGWEVTALDAIAFPKLSAGRDFLCRFRVKAPPNVVLDGIKGHPLAGHLDATGSRQTRELELGAGNIFKWNVLGPLDTADPWREQQLQGLETAIDTRKLHVGRNGAPLRWVPYVSRDLHSGYIDMAGLFDMRETFAPMPQAANPKYVRTQERAIGLAFAYVDSPSAREAHLHAGAPYGLELMLNGQPVFEMTGHDFNFHCDQFQIPIRLNRGRNTLVAKVVREKLPELNLSPWMGFAVRVTDQNQQPFRDLKFAFE